MMKEAIRLEVSNHVFVALRYKIIDTILLLTQPEIDDGVNIVVKTEKDSGEILTMTVVGIEKVIDGYEVKLRFVDNSPIH